MRAHRRHLGLVLGPLLTSVLLVPSGAEAVGTDDPVIVSPADESIQYQGFAGPFEIDFDNAPFATYEYRVNAEPLGGPVTTVAGPFEHEWSAEVDPVAELTLPNALPPGDDYVFRITDGEGHLASIAFEVRSGPRPRCSVVVPSMIRVNAPGELVGGRLSSNCAAADVTAASWDVRRPGGIFYNSYIFGNNTTDSWPYFDPDPLGTYTVVPNHADNPAGDDILQNTPSIQIRVDSRVALTAVRDGAYLSLRTTLTKYSRTANGFRPWGSHGVILAARACTSCPWKLVATPTTNVHGKTSTRIRYPGALEYRATSPGTTVIWGPIAKYLKR